MHNYIIISGACNDIHLLLWKCTSFAGCQNLCFSFELGIKPEDIWYANWYHLASRDMSLHNNTQTLDLYVHAKYVPCVYISSVLAKFSQNQSLPH